MKNQFYSPTEDDWQLFFTTPIFSGYSPSMIIKTILVSDCRQYQAGETMIFQGQPALAFHLILDGKVMVYRESPSGSRTALRTATSGDVLGLPAVARRQGRYQYTCMPLTGARSQVFPREALACLLANISASTSTIMRLISTDNQVENQTADPNQTVSASSLVAGYIIQRLGSIGVELANLATIQLDLRPLVKTAHLIGISETALSQTIADFVNRKMIDDHDGCITIRNFTAIKGVPRAPMESIPLSVSNG